MSGLGGGRDGKTTSSAEEEAAARELPQPRGPGLRWEPPARRPQARHVPERVLLQGVEGNRRSGPRAPGGSTRGTRDQRGGPVRGRKERGRPACGYWQ